MTPGVTFGGTWSVGATEGVLTPFPLQRWGEFFLSGNLYETGRKTVSVGPCFQQWPPSTVTRQTQMLYIKEPSAKECEPTAPVNDPYLALGNVT